MGLCACARLSSPDLYGVGSRLIVNACCEIFRDGGEEEELLVSESGWLGGFLRGKKEESAERWQG